MDLVDIDRLLVLVEAKPELYDFTRKGHHNLDVIGKAWKAIGKEMNIAGHVCRNKWHTLRSSYGRYLRGLKNMPSGFSGRKKKWYLADAMSFLRPYMAPRKKTGSSLPVTDGDEDAVIQNLEDDETYAAEAEGGDDSITEPGRSSSATNSSGDMEGEIEEIVPKKKRAKTSAEVVIEPMTTYYEPLTNKTPTEDHPVFLFFKSLMPDIEQLSQSSQRKFKTDILNTLNYYVDLEEKGETPQYNYLRPQSVNVHSPNNVRPEEMKTENL